MGEQATVEYLRAAIRDINQLDDLLQAYRPDNLDVIGDKVNEFLQSLKRVQDGRHHLGGNVPIALIDRVDRENLNPFIYTMEELERGLTAVRGLEKRETGIQTLQDTIMRGLPVPEPEAMYAVQQDYTSPYPSGFQAPLSMDVDPNAPMISVPQPPMHMEGGLMGQSSSVPPPHVGSTGPGP